jgi:glycosyltransferase involved in cell wall biosynthesis
MKILINGYSELHEKSRRYSYGGPVVFTRALIKYVKGKKYDLVSLWLKSTSQYGDVFEVEEKEDSFGKRIKLGADFKILKTLSEAQKYKPSDTAKSIQIIAGIIKKESPDLVLLNGFSMTNWLMMKGAKKAGIPIVVFHHGLWFKEVQDLPVKVTKATLALTKSMEADTVKLSNHQIFLNASSLEQFEKAFKRLNKEKRSIVPIPYNGIYENKVVPKKGKRKGDSLKVGFVGRWDPIKHPEVVYELAREAKRLKKGWEFHAVTALGNTRSLLKLKGKFEKYVKVHQPMMPKELKKFYQSMDIMILPSRFDAWGAVVAEAALQNRGTLISPNVGWVNEYDALGMEDWIIDFKNTKKAIDRLENLSLNDVPGSLIEHVKKTHGEEVVMTRLFRVIVSVKNNAKRNQG